LSGEQGSSKLEEGLKLLNLSLGRIAGKAQHLNESVQYLIDELALYRNGLKIMNESLDELKKREAKANEHG
jgi:hypothetical protein